MNNSNTGNNSGSGAQPAKWNGLVTLRSSAWCCRDSCCRTSGERSGNELNIFFKIHFPRCGLVMTFLWPLQSPERIFQFFSYKKKFVRSFGNKVVRVPTLHFIWRMSKQTLSSHIMLRHRLNSELAGRLPSAESPRPLPAATLWSLRYPTWERHWPCPTSEDFWKPDTKAFECGLLSEGLHAC